VGVSSITSCSSSSAVELAHRSPSSWLEEPEKLQSHHNHDQFTSSTVLLLFDQQRVMSEEFVGFVRPEMLEVGHSSQKAKPSASISTSSDTKQRPYQMPLQQSLVPIADNIHLFCK
jgi:hypothetical protein